MTPQAVFLDTNIFDREQLNFSSPKMQAFVAAAKAADATLLVPLPTDLEVERHIDQAATGAVTALDSVRTQHPMVRGLAGLPEGKRESEVLTWRLRDAGMRAWNSFKAELGAKILDYKTVDLPEVMKWYARNTAPFGPGKKAKEFPDALAFSALIHFADESRLRLALVSADNDFKKACHREPGISHFPSIESVTEVLISGEAKFNVALALAEKSLPILQEKVQTGFAESLSFVPEEDPNGDGEVRDVKVLSSELRTDWTTVIGVGHQDVTVTFDANVRFSARVSYDDPNSWASGDPGENVFYRHRLAGVLEDEAVVSGVARLTANEDWSEVTEVSFFTLDDRIVNVAGEPPEVDDRDDDDSYEVPHRD